MTPIEQELWEKAGRLAFKETDDFNEGKFDDLFYRVALDYYTKLLKEHVLEQVLKLTCEDKMNERIKELIKQVGTDSSGKWIGVENVEKFAELIVRECIRVPYDMWDKAELNADIAVNIEHRIKEHFGVEE